MVSGCSDLLLERRTSRPRRRARDHPPGLAHRPASAASSASTTAVIGVILQGALAQRRGCCALSGRQAARADPRAPAYSPQKEEGGHGRCALADGRDALPQTPFALFVAGHRYLRRGHAGSCSRCSEPRWGIAWMASIVITTSRSRACRFEFTVGSPVLGLGRTPTSSPRSSNSACSRIAALPHRRAAFAPSGGNAFGISVLSPRKRNQHVRRMACRQASRSRWWPGAWYVIVLRARERRNTRTAASEQRHACAGAYCLAKNT